MALVFLVATVIGLITYRKSCPNDWLQKQGKCCKFYMNLKSWTDSKISCAVNKSQLVVIQDKAELRTAIFSIHFETEIIERTVVAARMLEAQGEAEKVARLWRSPHSLCSICNQSWSTYVQVTGQQAQKDFGSGMMAGTRTNKAALEWSSPAVAQATVLLCRRLFEKTFKDKEICTIESELPTLRKLKKRSSLHFGKRQLTK
ncbi:hypothetical protein ACRRTK_006035 [Alexandromys fortis]